MNRQRRSNANSQRSSFVSVRGVTNTIKGYVNGVANSNLWRDGLLRCHLCCHCESDEVNQGDVRVDLPRYLRASQVSGNAYQ